MFPDCRDKLPDDPFELANCQNTEEILSKLEIDMSDLSDKWVRFFKATLNPTASERFSVDDLLNIFQLPKPANYTKTFENFQR